VVQRVVEQAVSKRRAEVELSMSATSKVAWVPLWSASSRAIAIISGEMS